MTETNPYRPPGSIDPGHDVQRLPPHDVARVASATLVFFGGLCLLSIVTVLLLGQSWRVAPSARLTLFASELLGDLFMVVLLSLQIWSGFRSWHHRVPIVGVLATFAMCVLLSDTSFASLFSPACLAAVGVLLYTGWFRTRRSSLMD